jgi:hypothetical protein
MGFSIITLAFVVPGGLYVPMLRVSFGKGLVIALLRYVITLTIYALIGFAIISLGGGSGKKSSRKWFSQSRDNLPLALQVVPHDVAV